MMASTRQLIEQFYSAFQKGDFTSMQACYHPNIEFSDEVFPLLRGTQASAMWHMLVAEGQDAGLKITFDDIYVDETRGICHWEAVYKFSLTGRKVHNRIRATFWMKDGLIIRHVDHFNFWKWAQMAFGIKGFLIGWTPFFRRKVQQGIAARLAKFIQGHPEYQ